MKKKLFETLFSQSKSTHKSVFFMISIFFHGLLLAAIIAVPLLTADTGFPVVRIINAVMVAPPQPPPVPKGNPGSGKAVKHSRKQETKPKPPKPDTFYAPEKIADEIQEEEIDLPGFGSGDGNGHDIDGAPGWGVKSSLFELTDENSDGKGLQVTLVEPPKLIRRIAPQYPIAAKKARIEGKVIISAVTDIYGKVTELQVMEGHPLLRGAAVQAVRQWIYEPYIIRGIPKPVQFRVTVHFQFTR